MGTNYYLTPRDPEQHPRFVYDGGEDEQFWSEFDPEPRLHIGKSSVGWAFSLRVYLDGGRGRPKNFTEWVTLFIDPAFKVVDSYDREVMPVAMLSSILNRPVSVNRHEIDGRHCIAHGDGTYDLIAGEFC